MDDTEEAQGSFRGELGQVWCYYRNRVNRFRSYFAISHVTNSLRPSIYSKDAVSL